MSRDRHQMLYEFYSGSCMALVQNIKSYMLTETDPAAIIEHLRVLLAEQRTEVDKYSKFLDVPTPETLHDMATFDAQVNNHG